MWFNDLLLGAKEYKDLISIFKDLILAGVAIVGLCVTISQLDKWKIEKRGTLYFELARSLLASTNKLREEIKGVRRFMMHSSEQENPPEDSPYNKTEEAKHAYRQATGYQKRWVPVKETLDKIRNDLAEAEAVWSPEIVGYFNDLFRLVSKLNIEIEMELEERDPLRKTFSYTGGEKRGRIMYGTFSEKDEYNTELNDVIGQIKSKLLPYLNYKFK